MEKARTRPANGTVWTSPAAAPSPVSPRSNMMRTPGPLVPSPKTPAGSSLITPSTGDTPDISGGSDDLEFPGRGPSLSSSQTLFDPSAPIAVQPEPAPPSVAAIDETAMSPEEVIEAKLAAISLREGVTIGPPPPKQNGAAPSYARIVKRD